MRTLQGMKHCTPKDLLEGRSPANAQFIDVREPEELAEVAWPMFDSMPMSGLQGTFQELDKNRPVVILCRSGKRSENCGNFLESKGFAEIWNVDGGIIQAEAEGAPVVFNQD